MKSFWIFRGTGLRAGHKSWPPSSLRPKTCLTAVSALATAVALSIGVAAFAEEEWKIVTTAPRSEMPVTPHHADSRQATAKSTDTSPDGVIDACGEEARPADEEMTSVLERVADLWNVKNVHVYESVKAYGPHAREGGCVFYNRRELGGLLGGWMKIEDRNRVEPMLVAIMAHELGHELHNDFDPARRALGTVRCELEADQFAGYTLSRLNIRAENIASYYRLTGDDFGGVMNSHGNSAQRSEAFMQGWRRGENGLSEQSVIGVGGEDHP